MLEGYIQHASEAPRALRKRPWKTTINGVTVAAGLSAGLSLAVGGVQNGIEFASGRNTSRFSECETVQKGDPKICEGQVKLTLLDYSTGGHDGIKGKKTTAALRKFQREKGGRWGARATGEFDAPTQWAMDQELKAEFPRKK